MNAPLQRILDVAVMAGLGDNVRLSGRTVDSDDAPEGIAHFFVRYSGRDCDLLDGDGVAVPVSQVSFFLDCIPTNRAPVVAREGPG